MVTVGAFYLIGIIIRVFYPTTVFPRIGMPLLVLLSLIPLVIEYYIAEENKRNWIITAILAGLTFTIFPLCAGWDTGITLWKLGAAGAIVFGLTDIIFRSIENRMSTYRCGKLASIANAVMLYLASQCLQGLL